MRLHLPLVFLCTASFVLGAETQRSSAISLNAAGLRFAQQLTKEGHVVLHRKGAGDATSSRLHRKMNSFAFTVSKSTENGTSESTIVTRRGARRTTSFRSAISVRCIVVVCSRSKRARTSTAMLKVNSQRPNWSC